MNTSRFFIPNMASGIAPSITMGLPYRNIGLFGRFANSLKSFNWSGLLNGANKTLNVVNQTIPLVRQAGPMLNNMKSMMKLAKVFGNETTSKNINYNNIKNVNSTNNILTDEKNIITPKNEELNDNYPSFFV